MGRQLKGAGGKGSRKSSGGDRSVKASDMMRMPGKALCTEIAGELADARDSHSSIADALKRAMAEKKTQGIHPGAMKRAEALLAKAKKTDRGLVAVATELAHFDYYRDVLGLTKLIEEQGQMFKRPEAGEQDNEPADGDDTLQAGGAVAGEQQQDEFDDDVRPRNLRQPDAGTPPESGKPH